MRLLTSLLLVALLASGCLNDRVVTLAPPPARVDTGPRGRRGR